ncbi:hypothetical protein J007_02399 [Cryptococcus neoformans]|nr:hypothetical protein J007_02399 [Cryptococcus neoformans var. grubii]OXC62143.1 hypothetical protein C358_02449 [Cryptococcus neoformans var. grubii MW-RSA852]
MTAELTTPLARQATTTPTRTVATTTTTLTALPTTTVVMDTPNTLPPAASQAITTVTMPAVVKSRSLCRSRTIRIFEKSSTFEIAPGKWDTNGKMGICSFAW